MYFFLHSLLADNRVKALLTGKSIRKSRYRLVYNVVAIGGFGLIAWLFLTTEKHPILTSQLPNVLVAALGVIFLGTGMYIGYAAFRYYDTAEFLGLSDPQQEETSQLNTSGWNSIVRHPLYLATLLGLWGWFLLSPYDTVLLLAVMGTIYLYVGARLEEQKLVEAFGDAYRDYQKQVPMMTPRLTKWKKKTEKK